MTRADLIDSTLSADSQFDRSFGYYARRRPCTRFVRGWCLDVHDPAIGKYVAGRPKDLTSVAPEIRELTQYRIVRQFKIG